MSGEMRDNPVYWITGLSGAGKTTLGRAMVEKLRLSGVPVVHLDGDEIRAALNERDAFSPTLRQQMAEKYMRLCALFASQGLTVVCTTISLYPEVHIWCRENIENFCLVYLRASKHMLQTRNSKGLYDTDKRNKDVVGVDIPVSEPWNPDITINVDIPASPKDLAGIVLARKGWASHRLDHAS